MSSQIVQGLSGVQNVIQQKYVAIADIWKQFRLNIQPAGSGRFPSITGCLDQTDAERQIEPADQVGQEHETAGEYPQDGDLTALKTVTDFLSQLVDPRLNPIRRDEDLHDSVGPGMKVREK